MELEYADQRRPRHFSAGTVARLKLRAAIVEANMSCARCGNAGAIMFRDAAWWCRRCARHKEIYQQHQQERGAR